MSATSSAATAFELILAELIRRAVADKAPQSLPYAWGRGFSDELAPVCMLTFRRVSWIIELLKTKPDGWFERGWDDVLLRRCAEDVISRLKSKFGDLESDWAWGESATLGSYCTASVVYPAHENN